MDRTERIATLNDELRRNHRNGRMVVTKGLQSLGLPAVRDVLAAVAAFSDFTPDNDPHGQRDCAVMTVGEHRIIWKIDYYDADLQFAAGDPAIRRTPP